MRRVVSDTGPVLHLSEAQALELLRFAGEVHIPGAVEAEITGHLPGWHDQQLAWMTVDVLVEPHQTEARALQYDADLGAGEAEAIALARQIDAEWLVTDDSAARFLAERIGFEVHGSLGVVLWAASIGRLSRADAETTLDRLAQSSLWVAAQVLARARAILDQIFAGS